MGALGRVVAVTSAVGVALASSPAAAGPGGEVDEGVAAARTKAERFAKRGKRAYKAKQWEDAIVAFELAYDTHPEPRYLFNIGRAHEKSGDLHAAMEFVLRYVTQVEDEAEKEDGKEVYDILAARLRKTSGEVRLWSDPPNAVVEFVGEGGTFRGRTPLHRWLSAGTWRLTVGKTGLTPHKSDVAVGVGESVEMRVTLSPAGEGEPLAIDEDDEDDEDDENPLVAAPMSARPPPVATAAPDRTWTWIALGAGATLLATGAFFGAKAGQASDEVQGYKDTPGSGTEAQFDDALARADDHSTTANVLYGLGAIASVGGVALWWTW